MDRQLEGRRAFVSGSTQGIGYATARALTAAGADVTVSGRDRGRVDAAVEGLRAEYPASNPSGVVVDFARPTDVASLVGSLGEIDVLVNNVGRFGLAEFDAITDDEWLEYFQVNVMSGVRLSRHVLSGMLDRGWGRVVFISSESGVNVPVDMVHYGVTKAAVIALANGLAKRTRGTAVTVNTVLGGPTYSDGVAATVESIAADQQVPAAVLQESIIGQNRTTLLARFIRPDEIANLVAYLASPLSSATNGAAIRADGGVLTGML
ncbi:SDR family NAD(P)-dependent oxidoreductase [Curtobacterium sp. ISL-83]|uniref:SDR family NAD(P)-dependent oxidoreductase n=1 Tax=Curtobacterium sp. ISL-83 TaxID=2819145 RepID=UPI001BE63FEC|nr:SDR family oxidoreductase [Curtobacterium sp. ISL-83]MBT2501765.1 SDR family oxidoreductase [Curtobacterium sp. ISL-83]